MLRFQVVDGPGPVELHVSPSKANMYGRKRLMDYFSTFITDLGDTNTPMTEVRPRLVDGFADLNAALTAVLGKPTRSESGHAPKIGWDLPTVVIVLSLVGRAIYLDLVSPRYQAWKDEPEPEDEG
ncbi:DUF6301 family protein [Nocardia sp. CA-135398]|uniref:DUF6301 family protein n=1 Tax=Nocardia sp. CA-135398 TaxID=3239977 RepID=UPI003D98829D